MLRHEMRVFYDAFIIQITTTTTNRKVKEEKDTDKTAANAQQLPRPDFAFTENQNQEDTPRAHNLSMDDDESSNGSQRRRRRRWSMIHHKQSTMQKGDARRQSLRTFSKKIGRWSFRDITRYSPVPDVMPEDSTVFSLTDSI